MAIQWNMEPGNLVVFEISGQLGFAEFRKIQDELGQLVQKHGQVRILVKLKDFAGWESAEGWGDVSALEETDKQIRKMAIIGNEKWRELVEVFTLKGLRPVPIEYFASNSDFAAREWLNQE